MNKIKRNGNQILDANFSDETPLEIAEFSDNLTKDAKNKFVTNHNFGIEILEVYQRHRNDMHIGNICKMLEKLENVYEEYFFETEENRRKGSK
jgi:hypothetical protein